MNITRQECSRRFFKRNARTYLRGLKFDAFLSQDYLTEKGQKESNGIFHLLETLKDFCEIINGMTESLVSSKIEILKQNEEGPKSALLDMFVPVYKIFSLDPDEENETALKGTITTFLLKYSFEKLNPEGFLPLSLITIFNLYSLLHPS
jgi:hypothetical protein